MAPPEAMRGGKQPGIVAWAKKNPKLAAGLGIAAGAGVYYLYKQNQASSGAGQPGTTGGTTGGGLPVMPPGPNTNPSYAALEAQIARLNNRLTHYVRGQRKRRDPDQPPPGRANRKGGRRASFRPTGGGRGRARR